MHRTIAVTLSLLAAATLSAQTTVTSTAAFTGTAMCYDQARERLVFALPSREIWEWDGLRWGKSGATLPAAASRAVYDASRQRVFFVCGTDLCSYDGHGIVQLGAMPIVQFLVADPHRGRLVGIRGVGLTLDTQEWDGTSWQPVASLGPSRIVSSVTYDPNRHVTVAQAIRLLQGPITHELWEWDGATWMLVDQSPSSHGTLAFDSTRQQVIGVGSQTWGWNGAIWTVLNSTPPAPTGGFLATDPGHGRVWLFSPSSVYRRYVWSWNGTTWTPSLETPHPELNGAGLTFDPVRGRAVLFSGSVASSHHEWDGVAWHDLTSASAPSGRLRHAQVFDPVRGETIVFGGLVNNSTTALADTWAWNGTNWRLAATSGPSPRSQPAVAFDTGRGRLVLVGGELVPTSAAADHWEWDGVSWTQIAAITPIGQVLGMLGYDPLRARLVLADNLARTWEHNGVAWLQIAASTPELPGVSHTLAWNANRQRLQGHFYDAQNIARRFEWDGATWTPGIAGFGELAYDSRRDAMLNYLSTGLLTSTNQPASVADFGSPCGGVTTATSLSPFGVPRPGDAAFHLDVRAEAVQRPALIGFALGAGNVPLGNGCTLLLQNSIGSLLWFTDAHGFWHQPFALPNDLALRGVSLIAQAAVLDPASPGGLALSQGLTLVVGD